MNVTTYDTPCCMYCGSDAESIRIEASLHDFGDDPYCCEI